MEKQCSMCNLVKPAKEFYKESRVADGLTARCKECTRAAANTSYQSRREEVLQSHKDKYCAKKNREKALMRNYGMTLTEWNQMFAEQNYRCAICGSMDPMNDSRNFCVDHCHTMGHVRGILCSPCNTMLGLAKDDPNILFDAHTYLIARCAGEPISKRKERHGYRENDTSKKRSASGENKMLY
jgi:hypothetical protein